jgi:hypothetical protein
MITILPSSVNATDGGTRHPWLDRGLWFIHLMKKPNIAATMAISSVKRSDDHKAEIAGTP